MDTTQQYLYDKYGVTYRTAKISDILFIAANEYLWDGSWIRPANLQQYSCTAIFFTLAKLKGVRVCDIPTQNAKWRGIKKGLQEMGVRCSSYTQFCDFNTMEQIQQARYAWLMFAHDIALEQGV